MLHAIVQKSSRRNSAIHSAPCGSLEHRYRYSALSPSDTSMWDTLAGFSNEEGAPERVHARVMKISGAVRDGQRQYRHRTRYRRRCAAWLHEKQQQREAESAPPPSRRPALRRQQARYGAMAINDLDTGAAMHDVLPSAPPPLPLLPPPPPPMLPPRLPQPLTLAAYVAALVESMSHDDSYLLRIGDVQQRYELMALALPLDVEMYGCMNVVIAHATLCSVDNTVVIGDGNTVLGSSNMLIGNNNEAEGDYVRARGSDNRLLGRSCTNYDYGTRGHARGLHSVRLHISAPKPSVAAASSEPTLPASQSSPTMPRRVPRQATEPLLRQCASERRQHGL